AGGLKAAQVRDFIMDNNEVDNNAAAGLWCDIACRNVTYVNNRVHHNLTQGILFEISDGASIVNNALWENGWGAASAGWGAGIIVSTSSNVDVWGNVLAWNKDGIAVIEQARTDGLPVRNIGVHDNTILNTDGAMGLTWRSDTRHLFDAAAANRGARNQYWFATTENRQPRFAWSGEWTNLTVFIQTPGDSTGTYLSGAEKDAVLASHGMPAQHRA
ncbi:MAG TPA: right-handed parallel beta-helix repeat-containing protein, partial [Chloroflexota bacterium]|nr:right-handed parallel beta-helix repeat-containing protein [Chloroflexota bacterium]